MPDAAVDGPLGAADRVALSPRYRMPGSDDDNPLRLQGHNRGEPQSHVAGGAVRSSPAAGNGAVDVYSEDDNVDAYSLS